MKQETAQSTISEYHNLHKVPVRKYRVLQVIDFTTNHKRWGVVWFEDGVMYKRFPTSYGMRAAVRLANRLQKEMEKKQQIVEKARNSYTIGI